MKNNYEILHETALFIDIAPEDITNMLDCLSANEKSYKKGDFVLRKGSPIREIGIVLEGGVTVIKEDYWGNRNIIARIAPGETFAESMACADLVESPVSALATDDSKILFIDYRKIITKCPSDCGFHTELITNMVRLLARKNFALTQKMEQISCRTTRSKILSYLSEQAVQAKSNTFAIPFNRQELADYLCVERSGLSAELCKLRDSGILSFKKNKFQLHETFDSERM